MLLFSLAWPSAGESVGRVLCPWRLDEIEAGLWRAPPGAASLPPGRFNQNRVVLFETPPAVSVLASPRRLQAEAAAATAGTFPSVLTHRPAPEGQICRPKYSIQYAVYYDQNREFQPVDSARLQVSSFLFTSGSRRRQHHDGNCPWARWLLFCQDPQIATKQLRRSSNFPLQAQCPCRNVACILTD